MVELLRLAGITARSEKKRDDGGNKKKMVIKWDGGLKRQLQPLLYDLLERWRVDECDAEHQV